jgi:NADH dehydrogenase FAD-containing subunit
MQEPPQPQVVNIGAGFAGLAAARALRRAPVRITIVDRSNDHLFQPLLYQVATAALSPAGIATPIRRIFRRQKNEEVLLAEATVIVGRDKIRAVEGNIMLRPNRG